MNQRRLWTLKTVIATTIALFLITPSAFASGPAAYSDAIGAVKPAPMTADERYDHWLSAFQGYLDANPQLSAEQANALWGAINAAHPGLFDGPGVEEKAVLANALTSLTENFSCGDYSSMLDQLGGVTEWLLKNEVVARENICNCGGDDDCGDGYFCKPVNCTSPAGTTHWGMCRKVEKMPVEELPST